ncbi:hypothetical protein BD408DRAFT_414667 [Parasitella parasitica]|nr:hypothetical protein BD408DRAFT_414667 [Parasitella parasitica]
MTYSKTQSKSKSPSASMTNQDGRDAKRWLIIGAYQAGANEKQIARMCGINQPSVRRTILNFKKTGSPNVPRGLTPKERSKPFLEYDGEGNLIDSDDDNTDIVSSSTSQSSLKKKIRARKPSAKDLIAYVLSKAQQPKNDLFVKHEEQDKWRPPTPPRDLNCSDKQIKATNDTRSILSPPASESSSSPKPKHEFIRGYETWTMDDDKILMAHVLTRLSGCRWKEAEAKLRGKHSADVCEKRWEVLRSLLIRGANKSGTQGW